VEPPAPVTPLPTASVATPEPPPARPEPVEQHYEASDVTVAVSFVVARKHPASARVDAVVRGAPAWRALAAVDPLRDLDWLTKHDDDIVVAHNASDAAMDAAIANVAQPTKLTAPGVKAWRGVVNGQDTIFLRAQPGIVRADDARNAERDARDLVARPPSAPPFGANEAIRARITAPGSTFAFVPRDVSEMRVSITANAADGSAEIDAEADSANEATARDDATEIDAAIARANSFPVRLMTAGLLNHVDVRAAGTHVRIHTHATPQQIDALATLAATRFGSTP